MNNLTPIVPITDLRRRFGEITAKLPEIESILLTKGGEPFATLKAVPDIKKVLMRQNAGVWKNTPLDSDKFWKKSLQRKSRKIPIEL